jgi:hypothetical protein
MQTMIYISLAINIVVLVPIVVLMAIKSPLVDTAWGPLTEARAILWSIYIAILIASIFLVFMPIASFVAALLAVQVTYKLTTPFTIGSFRNPVVISNLVIATVHAVTLVSIFSEIGTQLLMGQ